jgi:ABC-type arginine/histidine transport system permease subunit
MIAAVMYLAVVIILTAILRKLEKVLGKSDRRSHHAK